MALVRAVLSRAVEQYPAAEEGGTALREYLLHSPALVERVYADEVQDCTPMELLSLMIACGGDVSRHDRPQPHPATPAVRK
jgi:hypothetical protein